MPKILIIDDDKDIAELVALILRKEKIDSEIINDSLEALTRIEERKTNYDLILLDIMMPNISGTELCIKIRDKVTCPIVFLSAKKELVDKMVGYEIGGDDYITKPFDNTELVLKIKSHLRLQSRNKISKNIITIGEISINKESFEVYKNNKRVEVSTREFELLTYLMENAGIALSKEQIFEKVWGSSYGDIGIVAVNIKNLREKLDSTNQYIITIWGHGYKFARSYLNEKEIN